MKTIDLNADLGEGGAYDEALLEIVSSCNVACGGHVGDEGSMVATIRLALENDVAAGAHPSYPDREGFGRRSGFLAGDALYTSLTDQVTRLADIAAQLGVPLGHLKPHGALYNDAAVDAHLADIVARVVAEMPGRCRLVALPDSELQRAAQRQGLNFVAEAFVDRVYGEDGRLVSRSEPGAVLQDIDSIRAQAVSLAIDRKVRASNGESIDAPADTLCIHGDTPGADIAARAVREALRDCGVEIRCIVE